MHIDEGLNNKLLKFEKKCLQLKRSFFNNSVQKWQERFKKKKWMEWFSSESAKLRNKNCILNKKCKT